MAVYSGFIVMWRRCRGDKSSYHCAIYSELFPDMSNENIGPVRMTERFLE